MFTVSRHPTFFFLAVPLFLLCVTAGASESSYTTTADVEVRIDDHGRLALLIDEEQPEQPIDGFVDLVAIYTARDPLPYFAPVRIEAARVSVSRVLVLVRGNGWEIELSIDQVKEPRSEIVLGSNRITLENGVSLQQRRAPFGLETPLEESPTDTPIEDRTPQHPPEQDFSQVDTNRWQTVEFASEGQESESGRGSSAPWPVVFAAKKCEGGGVGSTSCTKRCYYKTAWVVMQQDCSVECGSGYHACCYCSGLATANCLCRANG